MYKHRCLLTFKCFEKHKMFVRFLKKNYGGLMRAITMQQQQYNRNNNQNNDNEIIIIIITIVIIIIIIVTSIMKTKNYLF